MTKLIYDIGMHDGEDTNFYLKKGFDVVAVDCVPAWIEKARERFAVEIAEKQLIVIETAIDSEEGERTFYYNEVRSEWSSLKLSVAQREEDTCHEINVQCRTLASIVEQHGMPYYIKIDVDGALGESVISLRDNNITPPFISVESPGFIHPLYKMGYRAFKFVSQKKVPQQRLPRPVREGKNIKHRFLHGSSGMFGEETPGTWKNFEESKLLLEQIVEEGKTLQQCWYDVHARLKPISSKDVPFPPEKKVYL